MGAHGVVVHWNQGNACATTIEQLADSGVIDAITVVDNGSAEAELNAVREAAREASRPVDVIELGHNAGFGPATNVGWRYWLNGSASEWCFVCPHDARPDHGTLAAMLDAAGGRPELGLLSADVGDGLVPVVDRTLGPIPGGRLPDTGFVPSDYPHGTLFAARRSCLEQIGLFDERYFAYCEEADLGLRARAAGWEVGIAAGARVRNPRVSTRTATADYLMERNTLQLIRRHFGWGRFTVRLAIASLQYLAAIVRRPDRPSDWSARARPLAWLHAVTDRSGRPPRRLT